MRDRAVRPAQRCHKPIETNVYYSRGVADAGGAVATGPRPSGHLQLGLGSATAELHRTLVATIKCTTKTPRQIHLVVAPATPEGESQLSVINGW